MTEQSISLVLGGLLGFAFAASAFAVMLAVSRRSAPPPPIERDELLRLRLAQHWARGGLLSQDSEPWRPACLAIAVGALGSSSMSALGVVLRAQVGRSGSDPQVANCFRQALAEYVAADTGSELTIANSDDWSSESLLACVRVLLEQAGDQAERIVAARSIVPPPNEERFPENP